MRNGKTAFILAIMAAVPTLLMAGCSSQSPIEHETGLMKIGVSTEKQAVEAGEKTKVKVELLDATNKETTAEQDLTIHVEARSPSGEVIQTKEVPIKAGESSKIIEFEKLQQPGVVEIHASQPQLLEGGSVLEVKSPESSDSTRIKGTIDKTRRAPEKSVERLPKDASRVPPGSQSFRFRDSEVRLTPAAYTDPQETEYTLTLNQTPDRPILANGSDFATIYGYLDHPAPEDIKIYLYHSAGTLLDDEQMIIPKGQIIGSAKLISNQPGKITVSFRGSLPIPLNSKDNLQIIFAPPITKLLLKAAPPIIPIVENAEVIVRLLDNNDTPITTDEPREVSFDIDFGRGLITPEKVTIKPSSFEERASFLPASRGEVQISASAKGFPPPKALLKVTGIPLLILILVAAGGSLGGLVVFLTEKTKWWRILIGLIVGAFFYWACLTGLFDKLPRGVVINEISALMIALIGGIVGTKVFSIVLRKFGL
ncbi:MAG TPA: hypothetical protein VNN73_14630 [Blastocatellia bacterium]|nr:hypothetical protein [Blastocatellia bacterium]